MLAALGAIAAPFADDAISAIGGLFGGGDEDAAPRGPIVSATDVAALYAIPEALAIVREYLPTIYKRDSTAARALNPADAARFANSPSDDYTADDHKWNTLLNALISQYVRGGDPVSYAATLDDDDDSGDWGSRLGGVFNDALETFGAIGEGALRGAEEVASAGRDGTRRAAGGVTLSGILNSPLTWAAGGVALVLWLRGRRAAT